MLCKLLLEHGEFELYSWNFLENFLLNIFNLLLVESADVEPTDTGLCEGEFHFYFHKPG